MKKLLTAIAAGLTALALLIVLACLFGAKAQSVHQSNITQGWSGTGIMKSPDGSLTLEKELPNYQTTLIMKVDANGKLKLYADSATAINILLKAYQRMDTLIKQRDDEYEKLSRQFYNYQKKIVKIFNTLKK